MTRREAKKSCAHEWRLKIEPEVKCFIKLLFILVFIKQHFLMSVAHRQWVVSNDDVKHISSVTSTQMWNLFTFWWFFYCSLLFPFDATYEIFLLFRSTFDSINRHQCETYNWKERMKFCSRPLSFRFSPSRVEQVESVAYFFLFFVEKLKKLKVVLELNSFNLRAQICTTIRRRLINPSLI